MYTIIKTEVVKSKCDLVLQYTSTKIDCNYIVYAINSSLLWINNRFGVTRDLLLNTV